jgi:hypothetical protein
MTESQSVLIQVDQLDQKPDLSTVKSMLEGTGVQLDDSYGPIAINPTLGRYVVRGTATPEAMEKAKQIPGVRLFADARLKPASR